MLRLRVVTGIVAACVVLPAILLLPAPWLVLAAGGAVILAAREWARIAGVVALAYQVTYAVMVAALALAAWWFAQQVCGVWLASAVVFWCLGGLWLLRGGAPRPARRTGARWGWLAIGLILLPSLVLSIGVLGERADWVGRGLLLYTVALVWAADIGAYFAGRRWGRHKLAPRVSAGKTLEGLAGGVVGVVVYALAGAWIFEVGGDRIAAWLGVAVFAGLLSVAGDLLESVLKREAGVKDSGALLPGHGGLLDRIDSLIAAAPAMVLGLVWLERAALP